MGHTCRDDVVQTSPMEELAHDLLATGNRSCGSWGPTTYRLWTRRPQRATRSSSLDTVGFSVPRVALVLWHDQQLVCLVCAQGCPIKALVAKILVEVLVAHDLADIGKKNELELARVNWHAKKNGNHPFFGHDQNLKKWQPSKQRPIFGS